MGKETTPKAIPFLKKALAFVGKLPIAGKFARLDRLLDVSSFPSCDIRAVERYGVWM